MANSRFGTGFAGLTDVNNRLSFTNDGNEVLAADLIARLTNQLWYDEEFGFPLERLLINSTLASTSFIAPQVEAELSKDLRVAQVSALLEATDVPGSYSLLIYITRSSGQSFQLVGNLSTFGLTDLHFRT